MKGIVLLLTIAFVAAVQIENVNGELGVPVILTLAAYWLLTATCSLERGCIGEFTKNAGYTSVEHACYALSMV